jgi:catechol 2,3-dioxygenase-like lactoylglutathione lyase family enzyme
VDHLAIAVSDPQRSRVFYEKYFGFDAGRSQEYDDGVLMLRNAEGFDLALGPVKSVPAIPKLLHFGIRFAGAHRVYDLEQRLLSDGVPIVETVDDPGYVSLKCEDPDGYVVQAYWEPTRRD